MLFKSSSDVSLSVSKNASIWTFTSVSIPGIAETISLICCPNTGINASKNKYKNITNNPNTSITDAPLGTPLSVSLQQNGFSNHAITNPIKNGLIIFNIVRIIGMMLHSFITSVNMYKNPIISSKYSTFKTLPLSLKTSFSLSTFIFSNILFFILFT